MGRKKKYPEHKEQAAAMMNELLDGIVDVWMSEKEPELKAIAEELEMSPAKLRKLLITVGERDGEVYFSSAAADRILSLYHQGFGVDKICEETQLSYTSVQGYLPHTKIIYSLDTMPQSRSGSRNTGQGSGLWRS